ncbi:MAG: hypothetical protein WBL41_16080, partial [Terracidiphilus sp.]
MRNEFRPHATLRNIAVAACGAITLCFFVQRDAAAGHSRDSAPLMKLTPRFTAPDVPAMGPGETEVPPLKPAKLTPPGLPGNGLAQHPMLYIGEGYNKILLINDGKIAWTYSTGPG